MVNHYDRDWKVAQTSEVFRGFITKLSSSPSPLESVSEEQTLQDFEALQEKIRTNSKLRQVFQAIQKKLASDPQYRLRTDPQFVAGVMLLDLSTQG